MRVPLDERHEFDSGELPEALQWLRTPFPGDLFSLSERPGHLRLYGRESPGSRFTQSLVARRQQAFHFTAETLIDFQPANFQQCAGLICYYNGAKFHFFHLTAGEEGERLLQVLSAFPVPSEHSSITPPLQVPPGPVALRVEVDEEVARFAYRANGHDDWHWLPQSFDASILSDEASEPGLPNFTGAFVGVACCDLSGSKLPADFDYFEYRERD